MDNQSLGKLGENIASEYLKENGMEIISRNYSTKYGEIDLIGMVQGLLVFIEVKTRRSKNYGYAFEAVGMRKQEKIIKTSIMYIQSNEIENIQIRYDVVEVYIMGNKYSVNHIENAFMT